MRLKYVDFFKISLTMLLTFIAYTGYTQEIYYTRNGTLLMTFQKIDEIARFHSNEIQILLNLKTAEFKLTFPIRSLHSGIDSLDREFQNKENDFIQVSGFLNLNEINTQPHEPYHFKFDSNIRYNDFYKDLKGYGHLEHIPGSEQPACRLSLNFDIDDFELISGFKNDFRFLVVQSILSQSIINQY